MNKQIVCAILGFLINQLIAADFATNPAR